MSPTTAPKPWPWPLQARYAADPDGHADAPDGRAGRATRRIRALPVGADVPIIAMTANAFAEDRERCAEAGMNDFLAKPFNPNALFSTLLHWLGKHDA
jgi:CheY-like chemotaxis protein